MSPQSRYGAFVLASLLLVSGCALLVTGWTARGRLNPRSVEMSGVIFRVMQRIGPEAIAFDLLKPDGSVAASISGSTDTLCDPPYLLVLDVNQDGASDVYYSHCGGHGYVTYRNGDLVDVNLGQFDVDDAPAAASFWADEIRAGGLRLLASGAVIVLVGLAIVMVMLTVKKP